MGLDPPYLADRAAELDRFDKYLAGFPTFPRNVRLTGLRGVGKTVLLQHYAAAAEARGVLVISHACDQTFAGLQSWVETTLADAPEMTALIVHNEPLLGFLPAILAERGLSVPRDMSVVALCPDDLAVQHSVSYSNIRLPADELGRAAVEIVVRQMAGATTTETRLLAPSLTRRRSTAPH